MINALSKVFFVRLTWQFYGSVLHLQVLWNGVAFLYEEIGSIFLDSFYIPTTLFLCFIHWFTCKYVSMLPCLWGQPDCLVGKKTFSIMFSFSKGFIGFCVALWFLYIFLVAEVKLSFHFLWFQKLSRLSKSVLRLLETAIPVCRIAYLFMIPLFLLLFLHWF